MAWNKNRYKKGTPTYIDPKNYHGVGLWNRFEDIDDEVFWNDLDIDFDEGFIIEDEDGNELEGIDLSELVASKHLSGGLEE